jgi:REP element-mobilizing transposase RayT
VTGLSLSLPETCDESEPTGSAHNDSLLASATMARQPRNELPDGVFHVTAHSVFGLELFTDDRDRYVFLWLLGEVTERFPIRCLAYCVMGAHYHVLLEGTTADLAAAMRRLNGRYARYFNERHNRSGHLFAERYSARVVVDERHLEQLYEYIEANPAKAGLCDGDEPWPWTWLSRGREDGCHGRVPVPESSARRSLSSDRLKPVTAVRSAPND